MTVDFIVKTLGGHSEKYVRKITDSRMLWRGFTAYQKRFAPSVVNNSIGTLRAIFAWQLSRGRASQIRLRRSNVCDYGKNRFVCRVATNLSPSWRRLKRQGHRNQKTARTSCVSLLIRGCAQAKRDSSRGATSTSPAARSLLRVIRSTARRTMKSGACR